MNVFILKTIEKGLNYSLGLDSSSKERLAELEGSRVLIELKGLELKIILQFEKNKLFVDPCHSGEGDKDADTIIRGAPFSLLHLIMSKQNRNRFFVEDVVIEGNLDIAEKMMALFDQLDIDWEEYFSKWIGDVPAYQTGRFVHKLKKFSQQVNQSLLQTINEYLHEESELVPPKEALHDFYNEVDDLRMDVDRLYARMNRLETLLRGAP